MLCIDNPYQDAYFNLAAEEYLLERFPDDVFMLWQNEASVIVGKHQHVPSEVNLEYARANQIKVVRRHSGGGAVYHDSGNLNLTFIESGTTIDVGKYTARMLEILATIGIKAREDERHTLYIDACKISGSAQFIRKNKVLFHATLLFDADLNKLSDTLNGLSTVPDVDVNPKKHYVKSVKSPVTNIRDHLSQSMSLSDFKGMIWNDFLAERGSRPYRFSPEDLAAITQLKLDKYVTDRWNFQS